MVCIPMVLLLFLSSARAGDRENDQDTDGRYTDEIVITARGYERPVSLTPGGIGVITAEDIEKRLPVSISDAIQAIPGVYKSSDSAWGSELSIRGASRDKVILLIDGSRVNTATDIGAQFGLLDPVSVERIEVLKGPISSLYGSGSIGGVVNVITRNGKFNDMPGFESGFSSSIDSSSRGYSGYTFSSFNSPGWYVFGSGSFRDHGSYRAGSGERVAETGFNDAEGTVNLGIKIARHHALELRTQYYEGWDIGIPGARDSIPATAASAEYTRLDCALLALDYTFTPEDGIWKQSKVHLFYQDIRRNVRIINLSTEIEPEADHRTTGLTWTNIAKAGHHTVVAGGESWVRQISSDRKKTSLATGAVTGIDTPLPDAWYLSNGLFLEDDWKLGIWTLNLGGRGDYIRISNEKTYASVFPATQTVRWPAETVDDVSWNGHAGVTLAVMKWISTSLLAASGYRAASLEERYKYIALGAVEHRGNPDLEPERSYFLEYALHLKTERVTGNASIYANFLRNLIAEKQIDATHYELQNVNQAMLHGAEFDAKVILLEWLSLHGDFSWVRGRDTKNHTDLPAIAPFRATAGISCDPGFGVSAFIDFIYTAAQNDVPPGMRKAPGWERLDAGLAWKIPGTGAAHRLYVACTNILDAAYYDYLTMSKNGYVFNEPGRSFKFGYSVIF